MNQCISVYPSEVTSEAIDRLDHYLALSRKYGICEVFTSIHLPEWKIEMQLHYLEQVAQMAQKYQMELTVDIGGPFIREVLQNDTLFNRIKALSIDFLRLDYGYDFNQLKILYHALHLKGFVINASMISEEELSHHLSQFKQLDENIFIKACHNFYVREESGLDQDFALSQHQIFKNHHIPVYYCAPCYDHPRGPLCLGLPTLEHHRFQDLDYVIMDLIHTYHAEGILYSDEWMSEKQFHVIEKTIKEKLISIPVILEDNLTEIEKRIILKKHIIRYDSNTSFLRSRSSREMAEYASSVTAKNCIERKAGAVTIDNLHYLRYSGEVQIVLKDADSDHRVNVAAHFKNQKDLLKLTFHRNGYRYELKEAE